MALEFLRRDCANINEFFRKKGIDTLSMQRTFDFVTDISISDETAYLTELF